MLILFHRKPKVGYGHFNIFKLRFCLLQVYLCLWLRNSQMVQVQKENILIMYFFHGLARVDEENQRFQLVNIQVHP